MNKDRKSYKIGKYKDDKGIKPTVRMRKNESSSTQGSTGPSYM